MYTLHRSIVIESNFYRRFNIETSKVDCIPYFYPIYPNLAAKKLISSGILPSSGSGTFDELHEEIQDELYSRKEETELLEDEPEPDFMKDEGKLVTISLLLFHNYQR